MNLSGSKAQLAFSALESAAFPPHASRSAVKGYKYLGHSTLSTFYDLCSWLAGGKVVPLLLMSD